MSRRPQHHHRIVNMEALETREFLASDAATGLFAQAVADLITPWVQAGFPLEYASIDGTGNNRTFSDWGAVGQPLERWGSVDYTDGVDQPAGSERLTAREVSNIVHTADEPRANAKGLSDMAWLFGQFIDHDITHSITGAEAFDITIPMGDAWFDAAGTGEVTMKMERSDAMEGMPIRTQYNQITAFIDGSAVYGSDEERAMALRTRQGGRLAISDGDLLPFNEAGLENAGGESDSLFLAGDVRANENAALTAMHTIWVREHNHIADLIYNRRPWLPDEVIYQQARRFVTAELQAITYNEFLPAILGPHAIPAYRGYDATSNPNIANLFSTAAYRFGHTMLSAELLRLNPDGTPVEAGNLPLREAFFNPGPIVDHGIDALLLGATVQTAQEVDPFLVDDVRNFLFGPPGAGGFDLASMNLQRGRDHGLADYNQTRVDLGLPPVQTFAEISSDPEVQRRLAAAFGDVDSIDAWAGLLAEDHLQHSTLGMTATTIIAKQFAHLRDGDRFFYRNVYRGRPLAQIEQTSLADVIARNSDLQFRQNANLFFASDAGLEPGTANDRGGNSANDRLFAAPPLANLVDRLFAELDDDSDREEESPPQRPDSRQFARRMRRTVFRR